MSGKGEFKKGNIPWNKGKTKIQDLDEIRSCKSCKEEKIITEFVKGKNNLYRYKCKECKNKSRRTGRPNAGRFKRGGHPGKEFEKGHIPWYKIKNVLPPMKGKGKSLSKYSAKNKNWRNEVKERDGWKCVKCNSTNRIAAHHIIPWKIDETKRFDVNNGITLCVRCHAKEEGLGTKIRP